MADEASSTTHYEVMEAAVEEALAAEPGPSETATAGESIDTSDLKEFASAEVARCQEKYGESLQTVMRYRGESEEASREEIEAFADEVYDLYDELFGIELEEDELDGIHNEFTDSIQYDWDWEDRMQYTWRAAKRVGSVSAAAGSLAGSLAGLLPGVPLIAAAGGAAALGTAGGFWAVRETAGGYYVPDRSIGVSTRTKKRESAFRRLAHEMVHAYQDEFDSPTFEASSPLGEGLASAMTIQAMDFLAEQREDDVDWELLRDRDRLISLLHAYGSLQNPDGDIRQESLEELGVAPADAEEITAWFKEMGKRNVVSIGKYSVGSAAIQMAVEEHGEDVYEEVFHGENDLLPSWVDEYREYVQADDFEMTAGEKALQRGRQIRTGIGYLLLMDRPVEMVREHVL